MTKAERTFATSGQQEFVLRIRHAMQNTMEKDLSAAVEELTNRKVVAFMSSNHVEPDIAAELFVLDEPVSEPIEVAATPNGSA
jgi:uncharacterized protein YbcI